MRSSITALLILGSLIQVMSWHFHQKVPIKCSSVANLRGLSFLMKPGRIHNVDASCESNTGSRGHSQYHETFHRLRTLEIHVRGGLKRKELVQGFQSIFQRAMEGTKLLWNGSRLVSRLHLENMILKILLIFLIHSLIKRNYSLELQLLATVILYLKTSCATPSPTSVYSRVSSTQYTSTPSLLSFQSTITSDHGNYLAQTLNATISQGSNFSSHIHIDMSVKTETTLTHLQGICDPDWIHHGDLCYKVVKETKVFNHAERFCVIHSAHLISIQSKEENDIIFSLIQTSIGQPGKIRIWLGMERLSSDSSLHWVDKKPFTYENWAPGEPDQSGACVQMIHKGWWEDASCTQKLPYICKKGSKDSLPYSRATELGVLIGIPMACSAIMLTVVAVLFVKSVNDSHGTYYGYGKNRNKDKIHSCLISMSTGIAQVGAVGYVNEARRFSRSSTRSTPSVHSSVPSIHSLEGSQVASPVTTPEITITPGTPESERRIDITSIPATSATSIEQDRFQSVTSLENLLSRKYIKPKTRRLRSLKKADAVVSPAGAAGKYRRKDEEFEFYEI